MGLDLHEGFRRLNVGTGKLEERVIKGGGKLGM